MWQAFCDNAYTIFGFTERPGRWKKGGIVSYRFRSPGESAAPPPPMVYVKERTVWQYRLITRNLSQEDPPGEDELNKLGKEGWELAGILSHTPFAQFYFKRLKE